MPTTETTVPSATPAPESAQTDIDEDEEASEFQPEIEKGYGEGEVRPASDISEFIDEDDFDDLFAGMEGMSNSHGAPSVADVEDLSQLMEDYAEQSGMSPQDYFQQIQQEASDLEEVVGGVAKPLIVAQLIQGRGKLDEAFMETLTNMGIENKDFFNPQEGETLTETINRILNQAVTQQFLGL